MFFCEQRSPLHTSCPWQRELLKAKLGNGQKSWLRGGGRTCNILPEEGWAGRESTAEPGYILIALCYVWAEEPFLGQNRPQTSPLPSLLHGCWKEQWTLLSGGCSETPALACMALCRQTLGYDKRSSLVQAHHTLFTTTGSGFGTHQHMSSLMQRAEKTPCQKTCKPTLRERGKAFCSSHCTWCTHWNDLQCHFFPCQVKQLDGQQQRHSVWNTTVCCLCIMHLYFH